MKEKANVKTQKGQIISERLVLGEQVKGESVAEFTDAVERGQSGERYIINDRYHSMAEIFSILEKVSGVSSPTMHIPGFVALMFAYVAEAMANLRGVESSLTVNGARTLILSRFNWASSIATL